METPWPRFLAGPSQGFLNLNRKRIQTPDPYLMKMIVPSGTSTKGESLSSWKGAPNYPCLAVVKYSKSSIPDFTVARLP